MPDVNWLGGSSQTEGSTDTTNTSTSHSTTTNTPGVPKAVLAKGVADTSAALIALSEAITGADVQQQAARQAASDAIAAAGGEKGKAEALAGEINASKATEDKRARVTFGTELADPNSDAVRFAAQRHDRWIAMDALRTEIERSEKVNFIDDPLGYLANTIRVPMLKQEYNQQASLQEEASRRIATIQQETIMAQNANTGATAEKAAALGTAKAAAEVAQGLAQSKAVLAEAAGQHASLLMQKAQLTGRPLELTLELARLTSSSSTSSSNTSTSHSDMRRDTESTREAQSARDRRLMDLSGINMKLRLLGATEDQLYTPEKFSGLDKKTQAELLRNAQQPTLGTTPGQALTFLDATDRLAFLATAPSDTPAGKIATFLTKNMRGSLAFGQAREELSSIKNPAASAQFAKMTPMEQTAATLDKMLDLETTKYLAGEKRNHFAIPPDSALYFSPIYGASAPSLKSNWVSGYIAERIKQQPTIATQPGGVPMKDVLVEAAGRVLAEQERGNSAAIKKISLELSQFMREGQLHQWSTSGAAHWGLPRPTEYVVGGFMTEGTGKALQTWNPAEVEHYLMMNAAKVRSSRRVGASSLDSPFPTP